MYKLALLPALSLILAVTVVAPCAAPAQTVDPQTIEAVQAIEKQWSQAEVSGDVNYINALLLPDYRSVGQKGAVHTKGDIMTDTIENGKSDKMKLTVAQYMKDHPVESTVTINGDVAIVTFFIKNLGELHGVTSSDVFLYRDGHWHAWYSQHSSATP